MAAYFVLCNLSLKRVKYQNSLHNIRRIYYFIQNNLFIFYETVSCYGTSKFLFVQCYICLIDNLFYSCKYKKKFFPHFAIKNLFILVIIFLPKSKSSRLWQSQLDERKQSRLAYHFRYILSLCVKELLSYNGHLKTREHGKHSYRLY